MADPTTPPTIAPEADASLSVGLEPLHTNGANGRHRPEADEGRDPYLGVLLLLVLCVVGAELGLNVGRLNYINPLLDAAVALGIFGGLLVGVLAARTARAKPPTLVLVPVPTPEAPIDAPPAGRVAVLLAQLRSGVRALPARAVGWIREPFALRVIRYVVALVGLAAVVADVRFPSFARALTPMNAGILGGTCLLFAAIAAVASRYMADVDPARLPEGPGLSRAARTIAWVMLLTAVAIGLKYVAQDPRIAWLSPLTFFNAIHYLLIAIDAAICVNLLLAGSPLRAAAPRFPTDLFVFEALGARPNVVASVLDSAERQLGIDLRSTWAVSVVRQSVEPLLLSLIVFGWISTSVTVVGVQEEALVERLGVPVPGAPLGSGLHLHLPWPIDKVYRIPTLRVQALTIGNESEPKSGPEDVLWSVSHVANEFTLLLGDGRDLITIDGTLQFRIVDARAWRYGSQNPAEALKVLAYRAVMRNTVSLTLSDALSENVTLLTARMKEMVQREADELGLGVQVVALTMSGMHPPTAVASAYEGVISAQIKGVTAVVDAQAFRNAALPSAETSVINANTNARSRGAEDLARAAGESWAFRTLLSQYNAAPAEYQFRRRLETMEQNLAGKKFTVLDARFTRDGGEVWIEP